VHWMRRFYRPGSGPAIHPAPKADAVQAEAYGRMGGPARAETLFRLTRIGSGGCRPSREKLGTLSSAGSRVI